MKIQKIQQLCKAAKRIIIIEDAVHGTQWISDGYCVYPLFNLPRLSKENIFAMFDIPEDKQGAILFEEMEELPASMDFSDTADGEQVVSPEPFGISAYGRSFEVINGAEGAMLVDSKYLKVFEKDAVFYERYREHGTPYIVVKEGMFLAGVVIPFVDKGQIAEWLVNTGEALIVARENDVAAQVSMHFEPEADPEE